MEYLATDFSPLTWALACAAAACAILLLSLLLPRLRRVRNRIAADDAAGEGGSLPEVSVAVTSSADSENLSVLLPQILEQDYPAPLEVIVVDDGDDGLTETVVSRLQSTYNNLYMTFVPANSRNLSRKKLAVTLGVKAARYDTLMLTSGHCRVRSARWLRNMMRHFAGGDAIVAGYCAPVAAEGTTREAGGKRLRAFERVRTSVQWLAAAIGGRPYRADGNNLAYTRRLFMQARGFSGSLNYINGDDDIFVSQISRMAPMTVELSDDSIIENLQYNPAKEDRDERDARRFTGRMVRSATPRLWGFMSLLWWLWLGCSVAASLTSLPSLIPAAAMLVVASALLATVSVSWKRTSRALLSRPLCLTTGWFMLAHPFLTATRRMRHSDVKHYSWQ